MSSRNSPRLESANNWMRTPMDRFVRGGQTINLQVRETIRSAQQVTSRNRSKKPLASRLTPKLRGHTPELPANYRD